jgi:hypothetical protein
MTSKRSCAAIAASTAVALLGVATQANAAACSSPYVKGDVFASVGSSTVDVFTPTGALVCTMGDLSGTTFTTGSGFDAAGNFYVTNFASGTVSKFNNSGTLLNSSFMTASNIPESINNVSVGTFAGSSFVGGPGAATIDQFNTSTGALTHPFSVEGGNSTGGTDWTDLLLDGHTVIYDGEGQAIRSYNLATNTQNPDFSSAATEAALDYIFALRVIPFGADAGDVLVANSINAVLLSSSGNIIKTYTLPGNAGGDFALNLDPNGTDFWTGDSNNGEVWEVNILTGAIDEQWNATTGAANELFGLSVFGEITSGGGGTTPVPEPSTWAMMLMGFAGLGFLGRRRTVKVRTAA